MKQKHETEILGPKEEIMNNRVQVSRQSSGKKERKILKVKT